MPKSTALTYVGNGISSSDYIYDEVNRLEKKTETMSGACAGVDVTRYYYDGNGNLTYLKYPSGRSVHYTYNNKNQVTQVDNTDWQITTPSWKLTNFVYNTSGTSSSLLQSYRSSNGLKTTYIYSPRNMLSSIVVSDPEADFVNMSYTYNRKGKTKTITDNKSPARNQSFLYDKVGRLTTFNGPWGQGIYQYDALGNRKVETVTKNGVSTTTSNEYTHNRLRSSTSSGNVTYYMYSDGNLVGETRADGNFVLGYDLSNRLSRFEHQRSPYPTGADYSYDGEGFRVCGQQFRGEMLSLPQKWSYDKEGRLLSQRSVGDGYGSVDVDLDYVYVNGKPVLEIDNTGHRFYHPDASGTILAMTDANKNVKWRAFYRPFGDGRVAVNGDIYPGLEFKGKELDTESGFYYFGARFMDPTSGRFISMDPIGPVNPKTSKVNGKVIIDPQRINKYSYALNDPINLVDPDGESPVLIAGLILGGYFLLTMPDVANAPASPCENLYNSDVAGDMMDTSLFLFPIGSTMKIGKAVSLPAWRKVAIDIGHIASGHMKGGARVSTLKTLFPEHMSNRQVEKAVREAYRYGSKVETQGERTLIRGQGSGLNIEMWLNRTTNTIETAYPIH